MKCGGDKKNLNIFSLNSNFINGLATNLGKLKIIKRKRFNEKILANTSNWCPLFHENKMML